MNVPVPPDFVEELYQQRIEAMSPVEKVARSMAMFAWTREWIARQILAEQGPVGPERLKWLVALRLYGNEPQVRAWIEERLASLEKGRKNDLFTHRITMSTLSPCPNTWSK